MKRLTFILAIIAMATAQAQDSCNYFKNETDEFTGASKIVMEAEQFIAHTDSSLLRYYKRKKKQYLETELYLAKIDDLYAVYLHTVIQTKKAYEYYGSLHKDNKIMLKLSSGDIVNLNISKSDHGEMDYDRNETSYSIYAILDEDQIELLSSNSVDKVRIYWSKGYEDYPCLDSGVMIRQLKCLK